MADLKEGDPVYYWDGEERPEKPRVGYFVEYLEGGRLNIKISSRARPVIWDHAEPFCPPSERWTDDFGSEIKSGDAVEVWDNEFSDRITTALFRKDKYGYVTKDEDDTTPLYWQHAKKAPPISKGTLVAAWNGEVEPEWPDIGFYERPGDYGERIIRRGVVASKQEDTYTFTRDNVRPITPEDLKRWAGGE